ncbi:MAG: hypothetical protein KAJ14_13655, partial [Candidatus Omnitrophica bacterium]|nr:hypothetical protein [Candidatus Omnitrophota bacterium]
DIPDNKIAERIGYYAELIQALNNAKLGEKIFAENLNPMAYKSIFALAYADIMKTHQTSEAAKTAHLEAGIKCFKALIELGDISPAVLKMGDEIYNKIKEDGWQQLSLSTLNVYIEALVKAEKIEKILDKFQVEGAERDLIDLFLIIAQTRYANHSPIYFTVCSRLYKTLSSCKELKDFPKLNAYARELESKIKDYPKSIPIAPASWTPDKDLNDFIDSLFEAGMFDELFSQKIGGKNIIQQVLGYIETAANKISDKGEAAKYRAESYAQIMPVLFKMLYYWENAKGEVKKPKEALSLEQRIQKMLPGLQEADIKKLLALLSDKQVQELAEKIVEDLKKEFGAQQVKPDEQITGLPGKLSEDSKRRVAIMLSVVKNLQKELGAQQINADEQMLGLPDKLRLHYQKLVNLLAQKKGGEVEAQKTGVSSLIPVRVKDSKGKLTLSGMFSGKGSLKLDEGQSSEIDTVLNSMEQPQADNHKYKSQKLLMDYLNKKKKGEGLFPNLCQAAIEEAFHIQNNLDRAIALINIISITRDKEVTADDRVIPLEGGYEDVAAVVFKILSDEFAREDSERHVLACANFITE